MKLIKKNGKIQWTQMRQNRLDEIVTKLTENAELIPQRRRKINNGNKKQVTMETFANGKTVAEIIEALQKFPQDSVYLKVEWYTRDYMERGLTGPGFYKCRVENQQEIMKKANRMVDRELYEVKRKVNRERREANAEKAEYRRLKKKFKKMK